MSTRNPNPSHASRQRRDLGFAVLLGLVTLAAMGTGKKLADLLKRQVMRNDAAGLGHFGAPRGSRTHRGLDLLVTPGEQVRSPIAGRFVRVAYPYAGDADYTGLVLHGEGRQIKLFYVRPAPYLKPGALVARGQVIGTAQDVAAKYGGAMKPHIHVEVRREVGAELLDPQPLLNLHA